MVLNAKVFNWTVCLNRLLKALTAVYAAENGIEVTVAVREEAAAV